MMLSFEVSAADLQTIRNAHTQYYGHDYDWVDLGGLLRAFTQEVSALENALREVIQAVNADPATYKGTTLAMIRDIAGKALGEPTEV